MPNPDFKITPLLMLNISETVRDTVTVTHYGTHSTQVYGFVAPTLLIHLQQQMSSYIDSIAKW